MEPRQRLRPSLDTIRNNSPVETAGKPAPRLENPAIWGVEKSIEKPLGL